jgi:hypothetical protein
VRRHIVLGITAIAITYLYIIALVYAIGVSAAQATPGWWVDVFSNHRAANLAWLFISHGAAIFLVSLPCAWVVARLYGTSGVIVSFAITLVIWGVFDAPLISNAM